MEETKHNFLVGLGEDKSTELAVVGGKGASLGRLVKAGFPVPSGFVVTTDAYAACLHANNLKMQIEEILEGLDYGNLDELEEKTKKIREVILGCTLPNGLTDEIMKAYGKLGDETYVAVRSSSMVEDLEGASFAGLTLHLNVAPEHP